MKQYATFAETEALFLTAINLRGRIVMDIAVTTASIIRPQEKYIPRK